MLAFREWEPLREFRNRLHAILDVVAFVTSREDVTIELQIVHEVLEPISWVPRTLPASLGLVKFVVHPIERVLLGGT